VVHYAYAINGRSMAPKDLDQYVGWVLSQKPELEQVDPEVLKQLRQDLVVRLEDQINAAILAAMPPEQVPFLQQLLERSGQAEVEKFCRRYIPDLSELVAGVLVRFKVSYLGA
jgi:hypothetical protein